jgi:hypothetical protein
MSGTFASSINTWLQPGVESGAVGEPFQRLAETGKPLKRFGLFSFR